MIEVEGVVRAFGDLVAVDDVSFQIGKGEIVGLLGHNGAGKTTIMKMLTGYLEPTAGKIEIDGLALPERRLEVQSKIGYLPENCPVYPEMTVVDYLDYAAFLHGIPEEQRIDRIRYAIAQTELEPKASAPIHTLSRGYTQRVGVAQAIIHSPRILILDEPTNGLDPTQIGHMRELIRSLAGDATIILSTHILQEVEAVCDRAIIVSRGKKVLDAKMGDIHAGRRLLVAVDASVERARETLGKLPCVREIHEADGPAGRHDYSIAIQPGTDLESAAAAVAEAAVGAGMKLFALAPERRELEVVFERTVSGGMDADG